jgi:hypothetical protein
MVSVAGLGARYIMVMTTAPHVPDTIGSPLSMVATGCTSTLCHWSGLMEATKSMSTAARFTKN